MDHVGRYQILEELGRGTHGVVYKALDPAIGRTIAIKAIALANIQAADRERVREDILREARLAGTLSHPNIVTVYDVVEGDDAAFIIMEFVDGESLESALDAVKGKRANRLTRAGFLAIFHQIAEALDYAHRRGVIHRDVKPANIGLTNQRVDATGELLAKIADFGVAQFTSNEITQPLGGAPALVGTPNYMSPEQVAGAKVGGASDQFSLAVIAYEVLTGQKAFAAQSLETLLYRIRFDPEEPVNEVNPGLSTTVGKVMRRALAKKPEERFGTCAEFAGALEFALGDSTGWAPGIYGVPVAEQETPIVPNFVLASESAAAGPEKRSWGGTLAMLFALGVAVVLAIILIVRMNSGPALPTQVLDTKNAPISAPPVITELKDDVKEDARNVPPDRLAALSKPAARAAVKKASTPVPVRPIKQLATPAEVQFLTDPPGANLIVDGSGVNSCSAPCSFALAGGRHTLVATLNGYGLARKIFNVPADASIFIPLVRSIGVLMVSSEPVGAPVNVDGASAGNTPLTLRLAAGAHRVSVFDGARWHDESVQVAGDEVHTRLFRF